MGTVNPAIMSLLFYFFNRPRDDFDKIDMIFFKNEPEIRQARMTQVGRKSNKRKR
jgi:hypothetical protein